MEAKRVDTGIIQDVSANRLMSLKEVEKRLHVGHQFLSRLLKAGMIPYIQIASRKKVSVFAVNAFIEKYQEVNLMADLREREEMRGILYE